MRRYIALALLLSLGALLALSCARGPSTREQALEKDNTDLKLQVANLKQENGQLKEIAGPPPASLDQYFPPKSQAPVFLLEMFSMAGPFEGIGIDLQEQDMAGVKANYQAFVAEYNKASNMVPEWKDRFPQDPVTALGTAINSGDPSKIGPAMGQVGEVCGNCHTLDQVKVQQKYHWPNFDDVKVTNPTTGQSLAWGDYMTAMAGAFEGVAVDLQEGQLDNVRKNFNAFNSQFQTLAKDGCKQCHKDTSGNEISRYYFVDQSSMAMVAQLGQALNAPAPDANAVGQLMGGIGNAICLNCHLVHLQAQHAKDLWEKVKQ